MSSTRMSRSPLPGLSGRSPMTANASRGMHTIQLFEGPDLLCPGVGVSVLDDGVDPPNDLIVSFNARLFIDSMLRGQLQNLRPVTWTYSSKASSTWSGHEPINVFGQVIVHLAIGVSSGSYQLTSTNLR